MAYIGPKKTVASRSFNKIIWLTVSKCFCSSIKIIPISKTFIKTF